MAKYITFCGKYRIFFGIKAIMSEKNDKFAPLLTIRHKIMVLQDEKMNRREAIERLLGGSVATLLIAGGLTACRQRKSSDALQANPVTQAALHIPCIACGDCMPCPYGVDIVGCFDVWNDAADNNELPDPKKAASPHYAALTRSFLADYHNRIPLLARAGHCINCHRCEPLCPQHIQIPVFLRQMEWVEQNAENRT